MDIELGGRYLLYRLADEHTDLSTHLLIDVRATLPSLSHVGEQFRNLRVPPAFVGRRGVELELELEPEAYILLSEFGFEDAVDEFMDPEDGIQPRQPGSDFISQAPLNRVVESDIILVTGDDLLNIFGSNPEAWSDDHTVSLRWRISESTTDAYLAPVVSAAVGSSTVVEFYSSGGRLLWSHLLEILTDFAN
jgi:hypothetical protein